jgi:hypothetical protein
VCWTNERFGFATKHPRKSNDASEALERALYGKIYYNATHGITSISSSVRSLDLMTLCWIIVLLPSTACGGIRPPETADGGYLRLPTEEQYLIYNSPYRQATFMRDKIALTMTMRSPGLFQHIILISQIIGLLRSLGLTFPDMQSSPNETLPSSESGSQPDEDVVHPAKRPRKGPALRAINVWSHARSPLPYEPSRAPSSHQWFYCSRCD